MLRWLLSSQLGPGKWTQTAACLIIGDEVLNGKTHDSNSNTLAKKLFDLGIDLQRVEIIPDEEEEVRAAGQRVFQTALALTPLADH